MCDGNKLTCIICGKELVRKQQKYCSLSHKKRYCKRRKWRIINAKAKTNKITKKLKRKFLIEQEEIKRKNV